MTAKPVFTTIDGAAWANALPAARKRRSGQGKRIAEAIRLTTVTTAGAVTKVNSTKTL